MGAGTETAGATFECDACAKAWPWKRERAGKKARCTCGQVMRVPDTPAGEEVGDAMYDVADDTPAVAARTCPGCGAGLAEAAVLCTACGFDLRTGRHVGQAPDAPQAAASAADPHPHPARDLSHLGHAPARRKLAAEEDVHARPEPAWRKLYLPVALIVLGVVLMVVAHGYNENGSFAGLDDAAVPALIAIPVNLALVIAGGLLAAILVGFDFPDTTGVTALKLAAVALAPNALGMILGHVVPGIEGDMLGVLSAAALTFGTFLLLFRLPPGEAAMCVVVIVILQGGLNWLLFRIEGARTGSEI